MKLPTGWNPENGTYEQEWHVPHDPDAKPELKSDNRTAHKILAEQASDFTPSEKLLIEQVLSEYERTRKALNKVRRVLETPEGSSVIARANEVMGNGAR